MVKTIGGHGMYRLLALGLLASLATQGAAAPKPVSLSPAVKKDVQCLLLFAAGAGTSDDDKVQQAAGFAIAYYYGRIQVAAPGLNLVDAVFQEAGLLYGSDGAEEIGAACDAEISTVGAELISFGAELEALGD